nr:hypothetical protein [Burkholderiales bacterium]
MAVWEIEGLGQFEFEGEEPPTEAEIAELTAAVVEGKVAPQQTPSDAQETLSARGSFLDPLVGQGLLMGAGDEIKAAVRAGTRTALSDQNFGDIYKREVASNRADLEGFRGRHPIAAPALEMGGAIAGVVGTGGASLVPRAATTAGRVALAAGEGAGLGGVYGFNTGEGGVIDRAPGALMGAGVGGLTGGVAGSFGARAASRAANKTIPTTDDLKVASQRLYDQADKAGVVIRPKAYDKIANSVALAARSAGMDHGVHPKAGAAITRLLDEVGTPKTLKEVDTLRRVLR